MANTLSSIDNPPPSHLGAEPADAPGKRGAGAVWPKIFFGAIFGILVYITLVPLVVLLYSSFIAEAGTLPFEATQLSFENYYRVLFDSQTYGLVFNTAIFTIGATGLGIGLAVAMAWLVERTNVWGRSIIFVGIVIPMAVPGMIYATAWTQLLNPSNGLINVMFRNAGLDWLQFDIYSLSGMVLVQGLSLASHAYLLVAASFKMVDPTWEEQSAIAGKGIFVTLRRITLPSLKPALLAAVIFYAIVNMETFEVPGTLGLTSQIHVFSTRIYWATHPGTGGLPHYGLASTLSVLLLLVAIALIWLYQRQTRNARQFVTVTGKGFRPKQLDLRHFRLPVTILAYIVLMFVVVLPLLMLVWRSLTPFYMPPSFAALTNVASFKAYSDLINSYGLSGVVKNTALMSLTAGIVTTLLASLVAWMVLRAPVSPGWRSGMNQLAFVSNAIPSIVIGLSFMFVYLTLPIPIYGTIWIIALAMVTKYIAFSSGTMLAAQMQISKELEEASQIAGAGWAKTYRRITFPLLGTAFFSCFLWVVVHAIRELAVSVMLYSPGSQVLSTQVWSLWEGGRVAQASALGVLTTIFLGLLMGLPACARGLRLAANRLRAPRFSED